MKYLILLIAAISIWKVSNCTTDEEWKHWKSIHNKEYTNDDEEVNRRWIWSSNYKLIESHNAADHSFKLKLNHFADLSNEEYIQRYLSPLLDITKWKKYLNATLHESSDEDVAVSSIDWRDEGCVTGVKNQGQCGSCWAFSATGALEAQHYRQNQELVSLSEQQLIDCSWRYGNAGCNGGLMDNAFAYVKGNGYLCSSESYPYLGYTWRCKSSSCTPVTSCKGYKDISSGSEADLTSAISSVGPISVAIDASPYTFQFYSEGVFYSSSCSSSRLNHGVLVVGYGTYNNGADYYIVKNR
jgi:cathepsin L